MTHDNHGDDRQNGTARDEARREVRTFVSAEEVAVAGAERFVEIVGATLEENDHCSVVLAGGSTYMKMYALLAGRQDVDWSRVHLFIGDERFVPFDDPQSNWGAITKVLMDQVNIPQNNLHPIHTEGVGLDEAARMYERGIINFFSREGGNAHESGVYPLLSPEGRGAGGEGNFEKVLLERARAMRRVPTEAENRMWNLLRDRRIAGWKFKRQHPYGPYILDFVCLEKGLVVEIDGSQHAEPSQEKGDVERSIFLSRRGFRVLRFWNNEVLQNPEGAWEIIAQALEDPSPYPLPSGERGIPTPFDLVLLGIGPDGHTLSIFPESGEAREPSDHLAIAVHDSPKPPPQRVSLSYRAANQAKHILFLVNGAEKKEALEAILHGPEDRTKWPAQGIKGAHRSVEWLVSN